MDRLKIRLEEPSSREFLVFVDYNVMNGTKHPFSLIDEFCVRDVLFPISMLFSK